MDSFCHRGYCIIPLFKSKGATDEVNQALNYGYAIIYNRVQSALIHTGLNIYYSILTPNLNSLNQNNGTQGKFFV